MAIEKVELMHERGTLAHGNSKIEIRHETREEGNKRGMNEEKSSGHEKVPSV